MAKVRFKCGCGELLGPADGKPGEVLHCSACGRRYRIPEEKLTDSSASAETIMDPSTPGAKSHGPSLTGRTLGQFRIDGMLGRGGMGEVYIATDTTLDRRVALKVLSRELAKDGSYVLRFEREAKAAARLSHPNIVQIFFIGEAEGVHFFAMEFIEGDSLQDIIDREGSLSADEAARIALEAAKGLRAAAREGLVHRDIKPGNLLRCSDGLIKVADFGLAKPAEADLSLTATGIVVGSPLYMSPEQGQAKEIDFRTDIYSLGATLCHTLAGGPPFEGKTAMAVILSHINEPLPSLPAVPEPLVRIVHKMMAKLPDDRYGSYDELIADIEAFLAGARVSAPPPQAAALTGTALPPGGLKLLAGNFARLLAFAVDMLIIFMIAGICTALFPPAARVGVFTAVIAFFYVVSTLRWGGTPGKLLAGIRVETIEGEPPGLSAVTWRFLVSWGLIFIPVAVSAAIGTPQAKALNGVTLLAIIAHLFALARADRRGLHDFAAGTMVVATPRLGSAAVPVGTAVSGERTTAPRQ